MGIHALVKSGAVDSYNARASISASLAVAVEGYFVDAPPAIAELADICWFGCCG